MKHADHNGTGPPSNPTAGPFQPASGRVVRVPANSQPEPLAVRPAEELTAVAYDERWPGYVLCGSLNGQNGWVPESVLAYIGPGMAIVRAEHSAAVLAIGVGDVLNLHTAVNGWYWATRADGQSGWVLAENVKVLDEA
jgi:hypothetical protein